MITNFHQPVHSCVAKCPYAMNIKYRKNFSIDIVLRDTSHCFRLYHQGILYWIHISPITCLFSSLATHFQCSHSLSPPHMSPIPRITPKYSPFCHYHNYSFIALLQLNYHEYIRHFQVPPPPFSIYSPSPTQKLNP